MFKNALLVCVGLLGAAVAVTGATPSAAETPDRSWLGVKTVVILSRFTSGNVLTPQITADGLCQQARAIAAKGSPFPISCGQLGDRALTQSTTAVLILDASVSESGAPAPVLVVTLRRESEGGLEPAPIRFGATPRAVPLNHRGGSPLNAALRASLGEILPWLGNTQPSELKPIRKRKQ